MIENTVQHNILLFLAIIGLEFRVVFLSAHEPRGYEDSGKLLPCLDVGGTVVNERVFNTMITRTKSLFVTVGNPFYLLDAEENLVTAGSQTTLCWREFLKTCIDHNAIAYPENCSPDQRTDLLERVFTEPSVDTQHTDKKTDSILEKTKKDIREKVVEWLRKSGVRLYRGNWILGPRGDSIQHCSDGQRHNNEGIATHILSCTKPGEAKAEPLHSSEVTYRIIGLNNRRGALDEALVKVEGLPLRNDSTTPEHEPSTRLGKVVQVVQQGPTDTFLCRVDPFNNNLMIPLSAKDPKLFNLPHISSVLVNEKKEQRKGGKKHRTGKHELGPVVCFDKDSLTQQEDNPRVRDVIPFKDAKNMLFLVMFIRWGAKFYFPLGAVIDVFPAGHSFFHAQRILKAQYHISQSCDEKLDYMPHPHDDSVFPKADFPFAFTLDQPKSVTLDDALSLKRIDASDDTETYEFGVHITSVASHEKALDWLEIAKKKGCTVYQPYKGGIKRYSMLPQQDAQSMSLDFGCVRKCISVTGRAEITCDGLSVRGIHGQSGTFTPQLATVSSAATLFYNAVEEILDGRAYENSAMRKYNELTGHCTDAYPPLTEQLVTLHLISQHLKAMRLEDSTFFSNSRSLPERQDLHSKDYPQASAMVQEFMVWASWKVAEFLSSDPDSYVPLRRQAEPSAQQLHDIAPQIRQALSPYHEQHAILPEKGIMFSMSTVNQLLSCMERTDEGGYSDGKRILMAQQNHPQLTVALKKWYSVQRRAEYCIMEDKQKIEQYLHFSLNCIYTHFSSPLRRCFDILVQMAILSKLGERNFPLSAPEARNLAHICNDKMRKATYFEREAQQVELAVKYFQSSFACSCYVEGQQGHFLTVVFSDPSMKDMNRDCCRVSLDALKYSPQTLKEKPDNAGILVRAAWKYKVCCLNSTPSVVKGYQLPASYSPKSLIENASVVHSYTVQAHMIDRKAEECFKRTSALVSQSLPSIYLNKSQWLPIRDVITQPRSRERWQLCAEMLLELKKHALTETENARDELYVGSIEASRLFQQGSTHLSAAVDDSCNVAMLHEECRHDDESSCKSGLESTSDDDSVLVSSSGQVDQSLSGPVDHLFTDLYDPCNVETSPLKEAQRHDEDSCKVILESRGNEESVSSTSDHLVTQSLSGSVAFQVFEVQRSISPADPLDVWVGTSVRNRIISPSIQLVQPVPGLDLCVQHGQWPEECFSDPVLTNASQTKYHDIRKYVDHWEPVLLAEAAMTANKEHDLLFLKDVALKFDSDAFCQPCGALEEPHFVYKKDADITLVVGPDFVKHSSLFFPFDVGNFVCARYEVHLSGAVHENSCANNSTVRAILHMVVKAVENVEVARNCHLQAGSHEESQQSTTAHAVLTVPMDAVDTKPKKVTFKFVGDRNSMFPSKIKQELEGGQHTCTMQLIACPTPMRYIYNYVSCIHKSIQRIRLAWLCTCVMVLVVVVWL